MLYQDITGKIINASFEVINELGPGFLESVYHNALALVLLQKGLKVQKETPIDVIFRGENVGKFYADLLVEDVIIVEIKATSRLIGPHSAQVINYLNATDLDVGLLINFGNKKVEYHRLERQKASILSSKTPTGSAGSIG